MPSMVSSDRSRLARSPRTAMTGIPERHDPASARLRAMRVRHACGLRAVVGSGVVARRWPPRSFSEAGCRTGRPVRSCGCGRRRARRRSGRRRPRRPARIMPSPFPTSRHVTWTNRPVVGADLRERRRRPRAVTCRGPNGRRCRPRRPKRRASDRRYIVTDLFTRMCRCFSLMAGANTLRITRTRSSARPPPRTPVNLADPTCVRHFKTGNNI